MYVRGAKKREEVWLLDRMEELGLADPAFRSRDYAVAVDEESNQKAGFGRVRVHKGEDPVCELAAIGVLPEWRNQGVGAHVVERLVDMAADQGFETVYSLTGEGGYLLQFGFEAVDEESLPAPLPDRLAEVREAEDPDAVPLRLAVDEFEMPSRLRERFRDAAEQVDTEPEETPEDFGIDSESATYKYDTGR